MSKIDNGGPAFPVQDDGAPGTSIDYGMTLRDYFAGQALAGLYTADLWVDLDGHEGLVARLAYSAADAMLVERTKEASDE